MTTTGGNSGSPGLVMIAGGGGFLGTATARLMASQGWKVVTLGLGAPQDAFVRAGNVHHAEGLIQRQLFHAAMADHGKPDVIIHAAGGASVGRSWDDPRGDFNLSVGSTVEILDFIREEAPETRLVLVSSAAVYGNQGKDRLSESDPCEAMSPYGLHKHVCEELVTGEARMNGLDVSIVRLFSIFGEGLRKQLLWDIMRRVSADPETTLDLWGSGDETRDFVHVDDAAAILATLSAKPGGKGTVRLFNGGSGTAISVRELASMLVKAAGYDTPLSFNGKARSGDPVNLVADATHLRGDLGFSPKVSLEAGLKRYADWFKTQQS